MSSSPSSWRGRALLVLLVTLSLLTATRGASALTAFERLVISELNATKVGGIDLLYGIRNYTVPTAMNAWDAGIVASVVMISADPYVLTQAQAEFLYAQTTVRYQDVAMPVRASVVRGCTAVHAMCCTYYWVTEEYPPGLDLADLDTSLVFWNGTHSTGSIDVNFTGTFPDVDCSATDASLIPVAQQRSVDTHSIVALAFTKNAAIKSPLVWDIFSGDGVTGKRRYVEFSTVHNTAPEQKAFIERMLANTFSAFGDPWQTLGEDAMNFQIPTDKLVKTTRSKSLGAIPVVVPIVVSAVLLALVLLLLIILCATGSLKTNDDDASDDVPPTASQGVPEARPRTDSFRRRGENSNKSDTVKRISPDSAMSSSPSQLLRVGSSASMGSQSGTYFNPNVGRPAAQRQPPSGYVGAVPRQGSFQGAVLPRTASQGSLGSRNGSFRVNMAALPPPPMPPSTVPVQGWQSPFVAPMPVPPNPMMHYPQQAPAVVAPQPFFPTQPGFAPTWQPSPPAPQPLPAAGPTRRLSQSSLRRDRTAAPNSPAEQKTSSFKRQASSSSLNGGSRRGSVTVDAGEAFANPLASRRPRFV